jgi:hypothetical protein
MCTFTYTQVNYLYILYVPCHNMDIMLCFLKFKLHKTIKIKMYKHMEWSVLNTYFYT